MDEDNIIKKKKKKNYYRHNNQNRYYYRKNKNKKKKNLILDNNDTVEIKNILLFNETTYLPQPEVIDFEKKKEYPKIEIPVIKAYELLQEKEVYEEEVIVPKQKKRNKINLNINKNILKYGTSFAILLLVIFGTSYSYFNYTKEDSRQADISSGEVYVRLVESPQNITLNKMYPMDDNEARSRNDNYFDFTIKAKNTSSTKPIIYEININNGEDVSGKTRINPKYINVDLQEKINNNYVYIKEGITLDSFNFKGIVSTEINSEITKEYRLRLWINDDVIVSDTDPDKTYTQSAFSNIFANFNISVNSEDKQVAYTMFKDYADTLTQIDFSQSSSSSNGEGLYVLPGTNNNSFPIYYYRGNVDNNNVIFGDYCWQIIRTTDTGGIKMIYNGEVTGTSEEPTCENTLHADRIISTSGFNSTVNSLASVGYMNNTIYSNTIGAPTSGSIFGKNVEWDGNNYLVIDDDSGVASTNTTFNATHHYTCGTTTSCSTVKYYYYNMNSVYYYINLTNGVTIEDALYKMTGNGNNQTKIKNEKYRLNENDSTVKSIIETWFKNNLTNEVNVDNPNYQTYLEDTIYCNDRSYKTDNNSNAFIESGWNPNGTSLTGYIYYGTNNRVRNSWYSSSNVPSFVCPNKTDNFSVGNSKAKLDYPVGLLTADEAVLGGLNENNNVSSTSYLRTGGIYWTMTPNNTLSSNSFVYYVNNGIDSQNNLATNSYGIRPVISLKLGTIFEDGGNGTPTNPYIVDYN